MLKEKLKMMNGVLENGNYQLGQFKFGELRKSEVAKENNENYLTDEEQHKIIIKDYDMLFEYRE